MDTEKAVQTRREALQRLAMFPLLDSARGQQRSAEETLIAVASGLTACGYLATSNHEDMQLAATMIATYLPLLQAITDEAKHQKTAAALISQAFQIKSRIGYHLEGVAGAIAYAETAVAWAKKSENRAMMVMAQRELLGAYEWTGVRHRMQALQIAEETQRLMEAKHNPKINVIIQSWVYTGLAKYQALNGLTNEMEASLEKAEETFFETADPEHVPIYITHSHARLLRHKAISYAYLGKQDKALQVFKGLIDLDNDDFTALLPMAERTYLGVLSEAMFSSLKVPSAMKDKELSVRLWTTVIEKAIDLQSETYFNEAGVAYQIMEGIWSDDAKILALRDALVHW